MKTGKLLWMEDDACPPDAESVEHAWKRLLGEPLYKSDADESEDQGDATLDRMPNGYVVQYSYKGNCGIYEPYIAPPEGYVVGVQIKPRGDMEAKWIPDNFEGCKYFDRDRELVHNPHSTGNVHTAKTREDWHSVRGVVYVLLKDFKGMEPADAHEIAARGRYNRTQIEVVADSLRDWIDEVEKAGPCALPHDGFVTKIIEESVHFYKSPYHKCAQCGATGAAGECWVDMELEFRSEPVNSVRLVRRAQQSRGDVFMDLGQAQCTKCPSCGYTLFSRRERHRLTAMAALRALRCRPKEERVLTFAKESLQLLTGNDVPEENMLRELEILNGP